MVFWNQIILLTGPYDDFLTKAQKCESDSIRTHNIVKPVNESEHRT